MLFQAKRPPADVALKSIDIVFVTRFDHASASSLRVFHVLSHYYYFYLFGAISLFAMQPFEPSDGCLVLRKLMANG
jgi:hypothetical protein